MARREYTAGRATSLASSFAIGASTFTIADDGSEATWPTSADYDFFVTIGAGTSNEERVLCSERTGRTITVAAGGRGKDATGEKNHAAGETAWPSLSAQDVDEANAHINSTGYSSHSQTVHGLGSGEGVVVGTTKEQTLTLKTLTTPKINENVTLTATATELNILDGATLSTAELNYVDGVTSAIQTQINTITPVGTIVMFGGVDEPAGWLFCNGQSTASYASLAAVVGANVPDLRGRAPIGVGTGAGLTARALGDTTGTETHALTQSQMPRHNHGINPAAIVGTGTTGTGAYSPTGNDNQQAVTTFFTGGDGTDEAAENALPHNIMQPSLAVNFIIKT
jgi:microcystin-dependent protein